MQINENGWIDSLQDWLTANVRVTDTQLRPNTSLHLRMPRSPNCIQILYLCICDWLLVYTYVFCICVTNTQLQSKHLQPFTPENAQDCNFVFTSSYLRQRMPKNASDGRWSVRASLAVQNTLKINLEEEKEADVVRRFRGKGAFIQVTRQQDARAAAGSKTAQNPADGSPRVF